MTAENYTYNQSFDVDPAAVYVITTQKASDFGSAISNNNLIGDGGTFALLGSDESGFSLQKITPGTIVLTEFEDKGRNLTDFFTNDTIFVLNVENREPFTSVVFKRKIDDGSYEVVTKNQILEPSGTHRTFLIKLLLVIFLEIQ